MCFFFNDTATTEIYTLSLHDALPISKSNGIGLAGLRERITVAGGTLKISSAPSRGTILSAQFPLLKTDAKDRKSTRLNSSHANISYAVFCLKKKKKTQPFI